jgi:hypothetical protein
MPRYELQVLTSAKRGLAALDGSWCWWFASDIDAKCTGDLTCTRVEVGGRAVQKGPAFTSTLPSSPVAA